MDRKYQKVEMGVGAFHHPPRAKYSEETKNLMKRNQYFCAVLMQESKISMMKRKSIQEAINKGESLPPVMEKSKMEANKHSLQYQARLID
ncbi:hypothetical protein APICC_08501 [Apis cerana cerana]|uniref:Uncharacterized protein n=1 Tax=Apis cerana cerana TaxID=94128 RepID=A0A2A3E7Q9_APICC|nr:hypothetical protein APICC_08501 [Apis cerana cerana]